MNISIVIPYHSNKLGLISLLTNLQNQTVLPDKIVVIDTSSDKSGYEIARTLAYHEVPIVVEVTPVQIYAAWNKGIGHCDKTSNILIINDDVVLPINFLQVMQYASENNHALIYVPETVSREHQSEIVAMNFNHQSEGRIQVEPTEWMPGFVFMLTPKSLEKVGLFDEEKYTVWFGDTDYEKRALLWGKQNQQPSIMKVTGTFVYHYGGKSYAYDEDRVLQAIDQDRKTHEQPVKQESKPVTSYACKKCSEKFDKPIRLAIHMRKMHKK